MGKEMTFLRKNLSDQVAENLREAIKRGELSVNSRFPSSRDMAKKYGVSHNVMLKALKQLQQDGLIVLPSKRKGYRLKK